MRRLALSIAVLGVVVGTPAAAASAASWRGANLAGYSPASAGFATGYDRTERTVKDDGGNFVSVVLECWMARPTSVSIDCSRTNASDGEVTIPDRDLIHAIKVAHRLGLGVALKPHVDVRSCAPTGDCFRGDIQPPSWSSWFASYRRMMSHYGRLARAQHVELLVVGTELTSSQTCRGCRSLWNTTLDAIRRVYRGPITYAANVDDYASFPVWNRMTVLGDDAYFQLVSDAEVRDGAGDPSVDTLVARWSHFTDDAGRQHDWLADLHAFSRRYHKPLLFTEWGYQREYGAANYLFDFSPTSTPDPAAQATAYDALFRAFSHQHWIRGALVWDFQVDRVPSAAADTDWDPRQQPAEAVLKRWWRANWP